MSKHHLALSSLLIIEGSVHLQQHSKHSSILGTGHRVDFDVTCFSWISSSSMSHWWSEERSLSQLGQVSSLLMCRSGELAMLVESSDCSCLSVSGVEGVEAGWPVSLWAEGANGEGRCFILLCCLSPFSEAALYSQWSHDGDTETTSTSACWGTAEGFCCFLFRNSSLRLAFLLWVEGLCFFLVPVLFTSFLLVSKAKEKMDPMEREKLIAWPWLASDWQNAMHSETREESSLLTEAILWSYFWIMKMLWLSWNMLSFSFISVKSKSKSFCPHQSPFFLEISRYLASRSSIFPFNSTAFILKKAVELKEEGQDQSGKLNPWGHERHR